MFFRPVQIPLPHSTLARSNFEFLEWTFEEPNDRLLLTGPADQNAHIWVRAENGQGWIDGVWEGFTSNSLHRSYASRYSLVQKLGSLMTA